jgi:hypothetical protein
MSARRRTHHARGWAPSFRCDARMHACSVAFVLGHARAALEPMLRTLDSFGVGPSARGVVVIEAPLVRAVMEGLDALRMDSEGPDVAQLVHRLSLARGDFSAVVPLAVFADVAATTACAFDASTPIDAVERVSVEAILADAERLGQPMLIATRWGVSVEELPGGAP